MSNTEDFQRPVREYPESPDTKAIQIDTPPQVPPKPSSMTWLLQLLYPLSGALISGVSLFATLGKPNPNPLLTLAEVSIMPLSVGVMALVNFLQRRSVKQRQKEEHDEYRKKLSAKQMLLDDAKHQQAQHDGRLHPDLSVLNIIVTNRQHLWERRPTDADFLDVRVGLAPVPLRCPIDFKADSNVKYIPELYEQAHDLVMRNSLVDKQPIPIALHNLGTLAVTGLRSATRAVVRAMLCQIVAFHAPNEVRIIAYIPDNATPEWEWLKWLPHTRRLRRVKAEQQYAPESLCLIADTVADFQELVTTQIRPELERRDKISKNAQETSEGKMLPHLVIMLDGFTAKNTLAQVPEVEALLRNPADLGMTILCLVDEQRQEPSTIRGRLTVTTTTSGGMQLTYKEMQLNSKPIEFIAADSADPQACEHIARHLAPLNLVDTETPLDFSQDVRLLDLLNISSLDTLEVAEKWQTRLPKHLLRVPIGRKKNGTCTLDLRHLADGGYGPHGMIVGATGSGKSELLRTIVTGLALTHDPHTVNFVLVDFKAGAAFADFAKLPHIAGILTDLEHDPLLVSRMYHSLEGEIARRKTLLNSAGGSIQQYQKKWRKDPTMEPLPYLLVIVDEFAQLITHYEDFLKLFTKLGAVGRSLGIHMMLATQRISEGRIGTLEGHLSYRICLRTFKPEESTAVIGTPDAYYLPPFAGSAYFKVGEDIYTAFKAALITTPYTPATQQQVDPATLIRRFTPTGKLVPCQPQQSASAATDDEVPTEMAMVIERITQAPTPVGGWQVHPIWLPPLKEKILLDEVFKHCDDDPRFNRRGCDELDGTCWQTPEPYGSLCTPIGMLDRPEDQVQEPVLLDFSRIGGHLMIVGAPQSGKSTLLSTIIASLLVTHSPHAVQLYCIDLSGGLLRIFDDAPHVGAVSGRAERDKTRRVLRRIRQIMVEREQVFVERHIDMATYRALRQKGQLADQIFGDVFLVIDNLGQVYSDFEASDPEIINDITTIVATGLTYGVHVIITANQWMEIRPRLRSNIGMRLELHLNDAGESDIDRRLAATIPPKIPGRGLHQSKVMFQSALPVVKSSAPGASLQQALEALVQRTRSAWQGRCAPQILVLPQEVKWESLPKPSRGQPTGVPIGLDELHLDPQVPLYIDLINGDPHFLILGNKQCGKTTLLRTWMRGLEQRYTPQQVQFALIDSHMTLVDVSASANVFAYAYTPEEIKECVSRLKTELEERIAESRSLPAEQRRTPQPWDGLHYFLFVDDYETVATPDPRGGNPLNPLEGLLQPAREIGFHLVLARCITDFGKTPFDNFFRAVKNMEGPGLIMRGESTQGELLHKQKASDALPDMRGYLVRRGYPVTLVQVANSE